MELLLRINEITEKDVKEQQKRWRIKEERSTQDPREVITIAPARCYKFRKMKDHETRRGWN